MPRVALAGIAATVLGLAAPAQAGPVYPGYAYDYRAGSYVPAPYIAPPIEVVPAAPVVTYDMPPVVPPVGAYKPPVAAIPAVPVTPVAPAAPAADYVAPAPIPYGWVYARPANCGVYHYWNGEACLDARYDPPPVFGD